MEFHFKATNKVDRNSIFSLKFHLNKYESFTKTILLSDDETISEILSSSQLSTTHAWKCVGPVWRIPAIIGIETKLIS